MLLRRKRFWVRHQAQSRISEKSSSTDRSLITTARFNGIAPPNLRAGMIFGYPGVLSMRHETIRVRDNNDVVCSFLPVLSLLQLGPDPVPMARYFTVTPAGSARSPREMTRENMLIEVSVPASERVWRDIAYKFRIRPARDCPRKSRQPTQGLQWWEHGPDVRTRGRQQTQHHNHMPLVSGKPSMPSDLGLI